MNQQIFRKKSLDRVSSPEQLNEYIRVANPSVWLILAAIVILLVGVCVWGVLGHLDTLLPAAAVAENGALTVYVKESDADAVQPGTPVLIGGEEYAVSVISAEPVPVDDAFPDYARHVGGLQAGEWVYALTADGSFADGIYRAEIVIERIAPMSFVLN